MYFIIINLTSSRLRSFGLNKFLLRGLYHDSKVMVSLTKLSCFITAQNILFIVVFYH